MRDVAEYLRKAAKFDDRARVSSEPILKENCADLADCYQCLASTRQRLLKRVRSSRNCRERVALYFVPKIHQKFDLDQIFTSDRLWPPSSERR
jgi:hypothetical protein